MEKEIVIKIKGPILPGSISTAKSKCGKLNCACKANPPKLHGIYYRWTGLINGKRTTKTISKKEADECLKRIKNYKKLKQTLDKIILEAINNAPWNNSD